MDDKVLLLIESEEYFATEDAPSLHEMIVGRRRILFGLLASADHGTLGAAQTERTNSTDRDQIQ
jgi:hypothetical protein